MPGGRFKKQNMGHLVAGKNATNLKSHLEVHHSEQFDEFKNKEQEKKTLKRKQYDAGNYSNVILCITWIKSRRLTSCLLLTEN